jgi:hypothetical protein
LATYPESRTDATRIQSLSLKLVLRQCRDMEHLVYEDMSFLFLRLPASCTDRVGFIGAVYSWIPKNYSTCSVANTETDSPRAYGLPDINPTQPRGVKKQPTYFIGQRKATLT